MLSVSALLLLSLAPQVAAAPSVTPSLATSPARPLVARAPQPVKLVAKDKVELSATYFPPKDMDAKNTAVLLVHDAGSDSSSVKALAEAWNKRGAAVLSLDLRGHGGSKAERVDWDAASEKEREVLWAMAKRDLEAAEEYLRDRREVHSSRIVVAGRGAGAGLAVRYGYDGAGIAGVCLVDPPVDDEKTWGIDLQKGLADLEGMPATMARFLEKKRLDFEVLLYDADDYEGINARFQLPGEVPVTLAIDASGAVVDRQEGKAGRARFEEMMRRALGQE